MRLAIRYSLLFFIILSLTGLSSLYGQGGSFLEDSDIDPYTVGGSIGLTASAYAVDGIENRRAPGMIQSNANLNFSLFGLRSGVNLNYSTDDSGLRQNMNALSYSASWRWVSLQAGDVNTRFSEYGLSGATIRGGYIRMAPGDFLLELIGGRSKRAVKPSIESGFRQPAFEQWAYGAKAGYGNTSASFFHLSTFYARDSRASIEGDTAEITPRENLSLTPDFQVRLFDGAFTLGSQVTVSVFTRDLNSETVSLDELSIPSFLGSIYRPRVSSRVNYAGVANAELALNMFNMALGYERVQPGFESLGRGRSRDDMEKLTVSPSVQLFDNRLNIASNVSYGRDNLLGNRLQTQTNTSAGANVQVMVTNQFSINTNYNLILNQVKPEGDTDEAFGGGQTQTSHNVMLQPNVSLTRGDYSHNVSLTGGYLMIKSEFDDPGDVQSSDFLSESITGALTYAITLPSGLSLTSSGNYLTNSSGELQIDNYGVNISGSYALFDRQLTVSLNSGYNRNETTREGFDGESISTRLQQLTGGLNASYRLTDKDSFSMTLRTRSNMVVEGSGREFSELEGSFQYQRTF